MVRCSEGAAGDAREVLYHVCMTLICIGGTVVDDNDPGQSAGWQGALLLIGCMSREVDRVAHSPTGAGGWTGIRCGGIDDGSRRGIVHTDGY